MMPSLATETRSANPFPGLRPFEAHEADRFFGRQPQIRELLGTLRRTRFLAVVGASGCGKSSLVRAGLVAALQQGFMVEEGEPWRIAILRPGDSPINRLADALDAALGGGNDPALRGLRRAALHSGAQGLVQAVDEAALPAAARTFVLVDQFEELFRFADRDNPARSRDEARAFVKLLIAAAAGRDVPIYVALTMRSEFLGDCADLPGLPEAVNEGLYLVPQMARDALHEAIVGPVEAFGGQIEDRLLDRLLNDLGDERDQLPLLQHAMMRLWRRASRRAPAPSIGLVPYTEIGGLTGALPGHLEEVYASLDPARQRAAELLFRALTELTADKRTIRRPTRFDRLVELTGLDAPALAALVETFRAEGRSFLMPGPPAPLADDTVIDISHESLIRHWTRLDGWVAAEAREAKTGRSLHAAAHDWDASGREPSYLFHGARLGESEEWARAHPERVGALVQEFLHASVSLRRRQEAAQIEQLELPRSIVQAAVSRTAAIKKGTSCLYLLADASDADAAGELVRAMRLAGREVTTDLLALETAETAETLRANLDAADSVLVLLTPAFCASARMRVWVDYAVSASKRLIPLLWRRVSSEAVHPALAAMQWIDISGPGALRQLPPALFEAVDADLPWVRGHARLLVRATEWEHRGRDRSVLLGGRDLSEAEAWLADNRPGRQPEVTPTQVAYILASRRASQRRLGIAVGAGFLLLVLLAGALIIAVLQRAEARRQEATAHHAAEVATERLNLLLSQWGQSPEKRRSGVDVSRSLAANTMLEETAVQRAPEDRSRIELQYYADHEIDPAVASALRGLGFTLTRLPAKGDAKAPVNAVWFGEQVPVTDAKAVVYALIRGGVDVKYIGRFKSSAGRETVVQIGRRPDSASERPLDLDAIGKASDFPAR